MKKTIITLLALCSASLGMAASIEATPDTTGNYSSHAAFRGFSFDFGGTASYEVNGTTLSNLTGYQEVKLSTITLTTGTRTDDVTLAIYKVETGSSNNASEWTYTYQDCTGLGTQATGSVTFTLDTALTLDTNAVYAFFITPNDKSNSDNLSVTTLADISTKTLSSSGTAWAKKLAVYDEDSTNLAGTNVAFYGNDLSTNSNRTAVATYGLSAVPEPATATLSLLALAGLAARRRRK